MYQYDDPTCATTLPTPAAPGTPGFFTDGNPAGGVAATELRSDFMNMVMMELSNIVTSAGLVPSKTTYNQVLSAIRRIGQNTLVLADTGAVNAYAAANATPLVAGTWVDGVVQAVKIAHTNTGPSTYAPDGLPPIPIYGLGLQALQQNELLLNGTAILMRTTIAAVNSGNPICVLMDCAGGAQQVPAATASQHAVQFGQLGQFQGTIPLTASVTLTASAFGNIVQPPSGSSGGFTVTLPSATGNINKCLTIYNSSSGNLILVAGNFNTAFGSATTTITIPPQTTITLECDGASYNGVGGAGQIGSDIRPHSISGIPGQVIAILATNSYTLPAGGSFFYSFQIYTSSSGANTNSNTGIAAGGTLLFNSTGSDAQGFAQRIM